MDLELKVARVSEDGKTWIWRYDWLEHAIERENKRCSKCKTLNVFAKLTIVHVYDDNLDT